MNVIKRIAAFLVMGLFLAPIAGYSANADKDDDVTVGEYVSDSMITAQVKAKFAADDTVSALDISVDTDKDGVVVLSGTANTKAEAEKAHSIAHSVDGVKKVINRVKVQKNE